MLPKITKVTLAPYADGPLFFGRHGKAREIIVSVQLVPKSVLFIIDGALLLPRQGAFLRSEKKNEKF